MKKIEEHTTESSLLDEYFMKKRTSDLKGNDGDTDILRCSHFDEAFLEDVTGERFAVVQSGECVFTKRINGITYKVFRIL